MARKTILGFIIGGLIGTVLTFSNVTLLSWQFYATWILIIGFAVNMAID